MNETRRSPLDTWFWRLRWYDDVFALVQRRILPREYAAPCKESVDRTKLLLGERLGRPVDRLADLSEADWQTAVERLESYFGIADGVKVTA